MRGKRLKGESAPSASTGQNIDSSQALSDESLASFRGEPVVHRVADRRLPQKGRKTSAANCSDVPSRIWRCTFPRQELERW